MAIPEFSAGPLRTLVAFIDAIPPEALSVFERRGFQCVVLDLDSAEGRARIAATDCVVLTQATGDPASYGVRAQLERLVDLPDHDCRLYVRCSDGPGERAIVLRTLDRLRLPPSGLTGTDNDLFTGNWFEGDRQPVYAPFVHVLPRREDWEELADLIARNPAGPPPNTDLEILALDPDHRPLPLPSDAELLIRRAFWNCSSVRLTGKANGLSGVGAYDAYATLSRHVVGGDWPYRFFVKLGDRLKVSREYHKYRTVALEHVPFHLGPRLRPDRCVLGRAKGLIVSDYVSGAETLRDCAKEGRGAAAIGNLFNQTLLAWRRAAQENERTLRRAARESERTLAQSIGDVFPAAIPAHRAPLIAAYGATRSPAELRSLFDALSQTPVLVGVIHGDLHATNVLVRTNDAVIIDLERIELSNALLKDPANLEGGLFIDGFIGDRRCGAEVLTSLAPLYTVKAFEADDHACLPHDGSAWFADCVRQIRMQAWQMERAPRQYALVLAAMLLKKACNSDDFRTSSEAAETNPTPLTREAVRALAYVLGERILLALSAAPTSTTAPS